MLEKVYEARRNNLRLLIAEHGIPRVMELMGWTSQSLISQHTGTNPTRNLSEKLARRAESELGLPFGWMDIARGN